MRILMIIVVFFISVSAIAEEELALKLIPGNPKLTDKIHIVVSNESKESVEFIWVSIELLGEMKWKQTRTDVECPCMAKCKKVVSILKPGQSSKVEWDFKNNSCNQVATDGLYRVIVRGDWLDTENRNLILGRTKPFRISK